MLLDNICNWRHRRTSMHGYLIIHAIAIKIPYNAVLSTRARALHQPLLPSAAVALGNVEHV